MDLTHVTASLQWVVSDTQGQDTQTYIMAGRDGEGVLSEEAASTTIRTVAKTVKLKQKYLFQRRNYRTSRFSLKTHQSQEKHKGPYLRGALKDCLGKVLLPRPSNPDPA